MSADDTARGKGARGSTSHPAPASGALRRGDSPGHSARPGESPRSRVRLGAPAGSRGRGGPRPSRPGPLRVVERNLLVYRRTWLVLVSGMLEPLLYLLSLGLGLGHLVGPLQEPDGTRLSYAAFVAPGLLASSAMNGAVYDSTFNIFHKLHWSKVYDVMLASPLEVADLALGEVLWALLRGGLYASAFLVVMAALGLVVSPAVVLAIPAALLVGLAFAGVGLAATTYMRSWQDFDYVNLVLLPLFLFSGTFYPLTVYPHYLQVIVGLTPLYRGVALVRSLDLGRLDPSDLLDAVYLAAVGTVGISVATRRLTHALRP